MTTDRRAPQVLKNAAPRALHPRSVEDLTQRNIEAIAQLEQAARADRTASDKVADAVAGFCGSTLFVWAHIVWYATWITANVLPGVRHLNSFPFPFLTLITSLEAIFLTTFVLISQNRQGRTAERRNHLDLQINLLAEQENSKMLLMLDAIMRRLGCHETDPEAVALAKDTQPDRLAQQIIKVIENDAGADNAEAKAAASSPEGDASTS